MEPLKIIRPELLNLSSEQIQVLMPYLWIFGGALLAILASVAKKFKPKWPVLAILLASSIGGIYSSYHLMLMDAHPVMLFDGMMISDFYSNLFNIVFISIAAFTALSSIRYLDREKLQYPEYNILLMFSALGMMLMAASLDLIVIFIALELMSLSVYVLVGFRRADRKSNEAAMKYFILGSAASAVLLYGSALLYGASGHLGIKAIFSSIQAHPESLNPLYILGSVLVLFGFLFKVASVPFHMWMPDVYEGAPVPVTGFMTAGVKAAAFATLVRVFIALGWGHGLSQVFQGHMRDVLWGSAVLTLVVGNFVALKQTQLKRILAYSSIGHTGYLLMGILGGSKSEFGFAPVVMYVIVYAVMNLGAFVVLTLLSNRDDSGLTLQDLSGIHRRHPWLAFSMAVFILSMAGIPPTAGFAAKYLVFFSTVQANEIALAIIGVLCSAVSVYYYLRVLVYMYMRDPVGSPSGLQISVWSGATVMVMTVLTLQVGVFPAQWVDIARRAILSL